MVEVGTVPQLVALKEFCWGRGCIMAVSGTHSCEWPFHPNA